jgi:hypothetical protein
VKIAALLGNLGDCAERLDDSCKHTSKLSGRLSARMPEALKFGAN